MSASECQVFGGLWGNWLQNFQFESPKMKLCEFVRVPTVSDWAKFAVQISKDEAPTPLLTVGFCLFLAIYHVSTSQLWKFTASLKLHQTVNTRHRRK